MSTYSLSVQVTLKSVGPFQKWALRGQQVCTWLQRFLGSCLRGWLSLQGWNPQTHLHSDLGGLQKWVL